MVVVAHYRLHPRPRPPQFRPRRFTVEVRSDAGGRVPARPVRVVYQYPTWDSPRRMTRDGLVLLVYSVVAVPGLTALGVWAVVSGVYVGAALAFLFAGWSVYVTVRHLAEGARGAGRVEVRGVVVGELRRTYDGLEPNEPYDVYFLAVDAGTADEVFGWEVPHEVYTGVRDGMPVTAVVSADGRYVYSLTTDRD